MTATATERACPKCGGPMWNNIAKKQSGQFSPKSPDYSCKNKECGGAIWPPRGKLAATEHNIGNAPWEDEQEAAERQYVSSAKAQTHGELVTQKLNDLMGVYDLCFSHAQHLAKRAAGPDVVVTIEGISAIAATIFISAKEKGLV